MKVRVGCELVYTSQFETPMLTILRARESSRYHQRLAETRRVEPGDVLRSYLDAFGNEVWRTVIGPGSLSLRHDVLAEVPPTPDPVLPGLAKVPVAALPDDVLVYTLPSRYCPLELFIDDAWKRFGHLQGGWDQVQAICDWLHDHIRYESGSTPATGSFEAYQERRGVCRDFAHLGIVFCRALNIPARYVSGYLPDIGVPPDGRPMDFHAWFEAFLGGEWRTFDARHNQPRTGRVLIAYGRDAVDAAFSTTYGSAQLTRMKVWADEVPDDFVLPQS
jgi:transglutaminase-like putative cysteine protease